MRTLADCSPEEIERLSAQFAGTAPVPDDPRTQAIRKYEQARRCFLEASAPLRAQLVGLYALYSEPRLLVHPDGRVESLPSRLPAHVQRQADQLQRTVDLIREVCLADSPFPVSKP